jgi:two-component sensor histidine kinase
VHPDDREHVRWRKQQILKSEDQYQITYRIRQPSGEVRWVMDRGQVEREPSGKALRVIGVLLDITDLKAAEQRQRLLFDELSHRVKNTLSIVQSLAQQTLRSTPEPHAFAQAFGTRLASLSHAHDLLTQSAWRGAALEKLVAAVLEPFAAQSGRVEIEGPSVELPASLTITIALMLHELATNAAKHGALAGPSGRVHIAWKATPAADGVGVELLWLERRGPSIPPPQRRGFGTRLLAASAQQIKGELEMAFPPEGLVCRLRFGVPRSPPLEFDGPGSVA